MPITNSTTPIASTAGITSGRFTSRVATSRITPKAMAGTQSCNTEESIRSPIVLRDGGTSAATLMPPFRSSHPAPAMNPPTTGYGTKRIRLPRRSTPSTKKMPPLRTVTTRVAATTVRKARSGLPYALTAVVAATTPSTAAVAACMPPTTPRVPALQARIASVSAAAPR